MTETPPPLTSRFSHALTLSYIWHRTQVRKGRDTPYLAHLMSVAALVLEAGGHEDLGIAGLLHDAIEDADDLSEAEKRRAIIREEFANRVADAVDGCTDGDPAEKETLSWCERKERYLDHLRTDADADSLAVSLCDKLHNARSILRDLRTAGEDIWARFNAGRDGSLWYYGALLDAYRSREDALAESLPGYRDHLSDFSRAVTEVYSLAGARREDFRECPRDQGGD